MGRISFFSALLDDDISWVERDSINSAHDRADAAMHLASQQAENFGHAITRMQKRITDQQEQIKMLRAMVGVLAAMLRDNGVVDGEILDARLEAAIENAKEEARVEANTITCTRCASLVPKDRTVITELGVVCEPCHARSA